MAKAKRLPAWLVVPSIVLGLLAGIAAAQDVKIISSRTPNLNRIAKAWNSIPEATQEWNKAMAKADMLLHARFGNQVLDLNEERRAKLEEERRKACVEYYKQAKEALLKELGALDVLIEEEDY